MSDILKPFEELKAKWDAELRAIGASSVYGEWLLLKCMALTQALEQARKLREETNPR